MGTFGSPPGLGGPFGAQPQAGSQVAQGFASGGALGQLGQGPLGFGMAQAAQAPPQQPGQPQGFAHFGAGGCANLGGTGPLQGSPPNLAGQSAFGQRAASPPSAGVGLGGGLGGLGQQGSQAFQMSEP